MIIQVNSTITDNRTITPNKQCEEHELIQKFKELFQNDTKSNCNINWLEDGTIEIQGAPPMSLHTFTLQAEAMGKHVKYHKKTIIEIN